MDAGDFLAPDFQLQQLCPWAFAGPGMRQGGCGSERGRERSEDSTKKFVEAKILCLDPFWR